MAYTIEFGRIGLTRACYDTHHEDCRGVCSPPAICKCECHPTTREKMDIELGQIVCTQYRIYVVRLEQWIAEGNRITYV